MPYTWADVLPGQIVDDVATNGLGNMVEAHDVSLTALASLAPSYRSRTLLSASAASVSLAVPAALAVSTLRIMWTARSDFPGFAAAVMRMRINADAVGPYHWEYVQGATATTSSVIGTTQAFAYCGLIAANSAPANAFSCGHIEIIGWDSPHTNYLGYTFNSQSMVIGTNQWFNTGGGAYTIAGPYTSITLFPEANNFLAGSLFTVEGWS